MKIASLDGLRTPKRAKRRGLGEMSRGETLTPEDHRRTAIEEAASARERLQRARQRPDCTERTKWAIAAHSTAAVALNHGYIGGFGPGSDVMKDLKKTQHDAHSILKSLSCSKR